MKSELTRLHLLNEFYAAPGEFEVDGLVKKHWSNVTPIRKIFREAFEGANLPYFNPHSFRHTLARLGENLCNTAEEFKA